MLGGFLMLQNIAPFLRQGLLAFEFKLLADPIKYINQQFDNLELGLSGLNILIGYLLITNSTSIATRLNKVENRNNRGMNESQ